MTVTRFDVRVMILVIGHKTHRIDKSQRVAEVIEFEVLDDGLLVVTQRPAW